jgi:hypothetical protein
MPEMPRGTQRHRPTKTLATLHGRKSIEHTEPRNDINTDVLWNET